jgi:hypothetical protein
LRAFVYSALALYCLLLLVRGLRHEDNSYTVWLANYGNMRRNIGEIDQLRFDGRATNIATALDIVRRRDPSALTMYGFNEVYRFNPEWATWTNDSASNEIAAVEVVLLKHDTRQCYLGVNFNLRAVELSELPKWANLKQ